MTTIEWTPLTRTIPIYDRKTMRFSLNTNGILTLNQTAFHALRSPAAVAMFYSEEAGMIGIAPADPGSPNAHPVRKRSAGYQRTVTLMHFCTRFGIPTPTRTLYFPNPTFDPNGVLILNYRDAVEASLEVTKLKC
ncbi:MAG: hypothetical protein ABJA02_09560 [Acidobacteriota bacterium]